MTHTPEQIAGKLTKAQRDALLASRPNDGQSTVWIRRMYLRAIPGLHRKGLVDYHVAPARLTPLGIQVRAILQGQS